MIRIHTSVIILIVIFVVVDIFGSASTSNSTCCGCFQRRNRDTLLEMYSVRTRYNTYKHRSEAVRPLKCLTNENLPNKFKKNSKCSQGNDNFEECEFADDAISLDKTCINRHYTSLHNVIYKKNNWNPYITVNGTEELPCIHKYYLKNISIKTTDVGKVSKNEFSFDNLASTDKIINNVNKHSCCLRQVYGYCTLPKNRKKKICNSKYLFKNIIPPKRITSDGTHIYYWCDLQKIENTGKCFQKSTSIIIP